MGRSPLVAPAIRLTGPILVSVLLGSSATAQLPSPSVDPRIGSRAKFGSFLPNEGQWDSRAQFLARAQGVDLWITERGATFDFHESRFRGNQSPQRPMPNAQSPAKRLGHVVSMEFVGGRPSPTRPLDKLEGVFHFLKGKDSRRWVTDVPQYAEVRSERVYDGVEARWYFDRGRPRYDLIVAPGADPNQIRMRFSGANWISTDGKELSLETVLGPIRHRDLYAYQTTNGVKRQVAANMRANGEVVSFEVGAYDRSQPLVIDPLIWSTFWGGSSSDSVYAVAVDSQDRPVLTGFISSSDMPTTTGAYDTTNNGSADIVVAKFNEKGETLIWCTYIGGTGQDIGTGIALTTGDNPFIAGYTMSADFPTTAGAHDSSYSASWDGVVSKLSADGKNLLASTYLGGAASDELHSIALDKDNRPVVVGQSGSADFPITLGSPLGGFDAYVTKFSSSLKSIVFSRFLGGSVSESGDGVRVDADSRVYVTGWTNSSDFPVTPGAFQTTYPGAASVFVSKLRPDGVLLWGTFLGGSKTSLGLSVDTDSSGNVVVGGETEATNFPTTVGAFDTTHDGVSREGFVSRLSADGSTLMASTLYGQAGFQTVPAVRVRGGSIFAAASGPNLNQVTPWGFAPALTALGSVMLVFNPSLSELRYGSTLPFATHKSNLAFDSKGRLIGGGSASSAMFPLTGLPVDFTFVGDGYVAKFEVEHIGFRASPRQLVGGRANAKGTVVLTAPAPSGGVVVPLSSNTSRLEVPESVTVPQGSKTATFTIRTHVVPATLNGMVAAKVGGDHQHLYFSLLSGGLASLTLEPDALSGGRSTIGKVKLSPRSGLEGASSPEITVKLSSSLASAQVPSSVVIPAGLTEATFTITTSKVAVRRQPVITATAGNDSYSQVLTINP